MTFQQMQAQKDKNSAAWHGADKATQDKLHQENLSLQAQMDKLSGSSTSFDKNSGTYKPSTQTSAVGGGSGTQQMFAGSGSTGGSYTPTSFAGGSGKPLDANGNTDLGSWFNQRKNEGASYEELSQIAADRLYKAQTTAGAGQYVGDKTQDAMDAYLGYLKSQQQSEQWDNSWKNYMDMQGQTSAAEQAAIDAAIKSGIAGLENQKYGVNQSADEAARQAYIGYMQSQKAMPQALSAAGYSGGMADSQRLALDTTLQNNQKDILLNRDNALNDIEAAIQKTRLEGSIQGAQSQAQLGRDAMSAYMSYISQKNAQASQDYWSKYGYDFQGGQAGLDREFQAGQSQANRDWQTSEADKDRVQTTQQKVRDDVINLLISGFMPGDDMLTAAGIDKTTAEGWLNYARQPGKKSGGGGGSANTVPTAPTKPNNPVQSITQTQYDKAADGFVAGDYSQTVIDTLLAAGDRPADLARAAGFGSIYDLGMGPIRDEFLAQMLTSGAVEAINIGGTLFYRKNAAGNGNSWGPGFRF